MKNLIQKDGKYYEECDNVMLPTDKATRVFLSNIDNKILLMNEARTIPFNQNNTLTGQHLYITSNEEIEEGDWYIYTDLLNRKSLHRALPSTTNELGNKKKIIATTDRNLGLSGYCDDGIPLDNKGNMFKPLPKPSNEFLKKFCKEGGIWEVMVEYDEDYEMVSYETGEAPIFFNKIKVAPDNTITIHPVEERMYSKEEVMELMEKSWDMSLEVNRNISNYYYSSNGSNSKPTGFNNFVSAKDWMKKQLK